MSTKWCVTNQMSKTKRSKRGHVIYSFVTKNKCRLNRMTEKWTWRSLLWQTRKLNEASLCTTSNTNLNKHLLWNENLHISSIFRKNIKKAGIDCLGACGLDAVAINQSRAALGSFPRWTKPRKSKIAKNEFSLSEPRKPMKPMLQGGMWARDKW